MSNYEKPTHTLSAKLKSDKSAKPIRIASAWPAKYGHSVQLEGPYKDRPGVAFIQLTDGTRITTGKTGDYFLNWNDEEERRQSFAKRDAQRAGQIADDVGNGAASDFGGDDSEIPF